VAPTDVPFLRHTLQHLVRAFRVRFASRLVVADVNSVTGSFTKRPPGSIEALLRLLSDLRDEGVIDEILPVDATPALIREAYRGVFSETVPFARDYRGAPIVNYLLGLREARTRYVLHTDGDMLVHQRADSVSWIARGIELLRSQPDIGAVLPLSGPPHPEGILHQPVRFEADPRGFYRFASFTSRIFLVDRERLTSLYPLDPRWPLRTPPGRRLANLLRATRGQSTLPTWEDMMGRAFSRAGLCRADLTGEGSWSLHPIARGDAFTRWLPRIIDDVEAGRFPAAQAGHYDLLFDKWVDWYCGDPEGAASAPAGP
jgi:hypothetical protein